MAEQEKYKRILKKVIDETEKNNIQSVDEVIRQLIQELSANKKMREQL